MFAMIAWASVYSNHSERINPVWDSLVRTNSAILFEIAALIQILSDLL